MNGHNEDLRGRVLRLAPTLATCLFVSRIICSYFYCVACYISNENPVPSSEYYVTRLSRYSALVTRY